MSYQLLGRGEQEDLNLTEASEKIKHTVSNQETQENRREK